MRNIRRFIRLTVATRIPLPAKVFTSYLLVVLVGALPTYFFLRQMFLTEFMTEYVKGVVGHAQLLANYLSDRDDVHDRVSELRHLAPTLVEHITYIETNGRVLFDSAVAEPHTLGNPLGRAEIERAMGRLAPEEGIELHLPRIGISRRPADNDKVETLYVAVALTNATGTGNDYLRLGLPISEVERLSSLLARVFRNSQAAAVSMAILLSLLAAIFLMRPLQRLGHVARALAGGDYTVQVGDLGHDEIGDVGRSLDLLGQELRKRLAIAQAGEAMLVQLVHGMHFPMAVFGPDGNVVAANGAARDAFSRQQSSADANFADFVQSPAFNDAAKAAESQGEPVHTLYTTRDGRLRVSGWVHILRHPTSAPFRAFLGEEAVRRPVLRLPRPGDLRAVRMADFLGLVQEQAAIVLAHNGVRLLVEGALPEALLADAHGRLQLAFLTAFCGIAATHSGTSGISLTSGASGPVPVVFVEKATRVGVVIYAPISDAAVETVAYLLSPIGGRVKSSHERCILFVAKA